MKVANIDIPYVAIPPKGYGGTELVILNLIKGLKEEGHEPILLGTGDSTVKCKVIPIVDKAIFFPRSPKGLPDHRKQLQETKKNTHRILKELVNEVDIVHSHGFDLKNYADHPNVTTVHGPIIFKEMKYYMERLDLNYVSISKNQQEAFPDLNWVGAVYNGEDPEKFPLITEPKDYVCFIGRFDREKNPHLAIQLAINLGIKIKLAGKLDYLGDNYFKEEVKPFFKHPLVEYLGEVGFRDKIKLISNAKCNLHPTGFREPFGLTILEAAYCGTPTMAIARGSMPELIQEGRTGMLVEDFVEGFHQMEECFNMDRGYIAKRARHEFNYKNMAAGYLKVYKKIIKQY
jgi:glycosyltransferase involved in cell wall biosynthesis